MPYWYLNILNFCDIKRVSFCGYKISAEESAPKVRQKSALKVPKVRQNCLMYVTYPMSSLTFTDSHIKWNHSHPDFVTGFFMRRIILCWQTTFLSEMCSSPNHPKIHQKNCPNKVEETFSR